MKRRRAHFTILFYICALVQPAMAQEISRDNELDAKYTPVGNAIFNSKYSKNSNSGSSGEKTNFENTLQFTPSMLFRKKLYVNYERKLGESFSFSFGLGKAFDEDYFQKLASVIKLSDNFLESNLLTARKVYENSTYAGSTALINFGMRYYSSDVFDYSFAEVTYRRESMSYLLDQKVVLVPSNESRTVVFKMQAFTFGYGYSWLAGKNNKMTNSVFINVGIKFFQFTRFEEVSSSGYYSYSSQLGAAYEKSSDEASTRIFPSVNMGYSFGFGF